MDLDIYRGKGDATPKKTNFSSGGERKKEEKKKKIVSWKKTGQDLDIPAFLPPCGTPIYITPLRFPLAYPLSLFISQFLRLTANYHRPVRAQAWKRPRARYITVNYASSVHFHPPPIAFSISTSRPSRGDLPPPSGDRFLHRVATLPSFMA